MFERDRSSTGLPGIPGSGPSGGLGLPGANAESSSRTGQSGSTGPSLRRDPPRRGTNSGPGRGPTRREPWTPGAWTMRLFVLVMIAAIAGVLVTQEQRNLDDPVQRGARGQITPASTESFLRANRLQQAIDTVVAAAPGTTITSLRVTPTQVGATMHHPDGREESFTVDPALELRRFSAGARRGKGLAPSKVPVGVPNRLVSLAVDRLDLRPEHLDYVLLSVFDVPNQPSIVNWGLYYSEPPLDNDAVANLDGTDLRLMGTPDAAGRALARKIERQTAKARSAAKRAIADAKARTEAAGR